MDFSAANTVLWNPIIQTSIIAGLILLSNVIRRKIAFIRNSLMPTPYWRASFCCCCGPPASSGWIRNFWK